MLSAIKNSDLERSVIGGTKWKKVTGTPALPAKYGGVACWVKAKTEKY